jgi:hypothetical protein
VVLLSFLSVANLLRVGLVEVYLPMRARGLVVPATVAMEVAVGGGLGSGARGLLGGEL